MAIIQTTKHGLECYLVTTLKGAIVFRCLSIQAARSFINRYSVKG